MRLAITCAAALAATTACAPLNLGLISGHEARLNAQAARIVLLEGTMVDMSPAGKRMAESGHKDVTVPLTLDGVDERASGYVVVVPQHTYAGSIARHFVRPSNIENLPRELEHLVRIAKFEGNPDGGSVSSSATFENLPDGDYLVAACDFVVVHRPKADPTQTINDYVSVRGVYAGSVAVADGACSPVVLQENSAIDQPQVSSSTIESPAATRPPESKRTWKSERSSKGAR